MPHWWGKHGRGLGRAQLLHNPQESCFFNTGTWRETCRATVTCGLYLFSVSCFMRLEPTLNLHQRDPGPRPVMMAAVPTLFQHLWPRLFRHPHARSGPHSCKTQICRGPHCGSGAGVKPTCPLIPRGPLSPLRTVGESIDPLPLKPGPSLSHCLSLEHLCYPSFGLVVPPPASCPWLPSVPCLASTSPTWPGGAPFSPSWGFGLPP